MAIAATTGLSPPTGVVIHDAANGYGGFASLTDNYSPKDQLRLVMQLRSDYFQIPYDPNPASYGNQLYQSIGLRDSQQETDGLAAFTYAHTVNKDTLLEVSPFYHYNSASYTPQPCGSASRDYVRQNVELCRCAGESHHQHRAQYHPGRRVQLGPA